MKPARIACTYYTNTPRPARSSTERAAGRDEAKRRTEEADAAIAAQRVRIAALRPANDNVRRFRGNLPALHWLAKQDPEGAWSVTAYRRATEGYDSVYGDESAGFDGEHIDEDTEPYGMGSDVDRVHDVRPSIREMLADLLRVRVVRYADGAIDRVAGMATWPSFAGWQARLAGMSFNFHPQARRPAAGGLMVSYTDASGRVRQPKYDTSKVRGADNDNDLDWCRKSGGKQGVTRPPSLPKEPENVPPNDVLELVLSGMSLKAIGLGLGYGEHYADRGAKTAIRQAAAWARERWPAPVRP